MNDNTSNQNNTQNNQTDKIEDKIVIAKILRPFKLHGLLNLEIYSSMEKYNAIFSDGMREAGLPMSACALKVLTKRKMERRNFIKSVLLIPHG